MLSILIVRSGMLEIVPALATFAGALVFAVIGIVLAFGAFIVIWKDGIGGIGHAFAAHRHRRSRCSPIRPISATAPTSCR